MTLAEPTLIAIGNEPIFGLGSERVLGWVTSGGYGYSVKKSIAYGYLPIGHAQPGKALEVEILSERVKGRVSSDPLWDAKGERTRF